MGRFRDVKTGSVVNVPDELGETLEGYEPADEEKKTPAKKAASRKKSDD